MPPSGSSPRHPWGQFEKPRSSGPPERTRRDSAGGALPRSQPEPPREPLHHALGEELLRPELLEGVGRPFHQVDLEGRCSRESSQDGSGLALERVHALVILSEEKVHVGSALDEAAEVAADLGLLGTKPSSRALAEPPPAPRHQHLAHVAQLELA